MCDKRCFCDLCKIGNDFRDTQTRITALAQARTVTQDPDPIDKYCATEASI
jgi:hypothetical protein